MNQTLGRAFGKITDVMAILQLHLMGNQTNKTAANFAIVSHHQLFQLIHLAISRHFGDIDPVAMLVLSAMQIAYAASMDEIMWYAKWCCLVTVFNLCVRMSGEALHVRIHSQRWNAGVLLLIFSEALWS